MDKENNSGGNLFSKIFSLFPGQHHTHTGPNASDSKTEKVKLKLVLFIVDWNRAAPISTVFEEQHVCFYYNIKGRGTASSEILDLLGIGRSDKAVILCLEQPKMIPVLLSEVQKKLDFHSPGAGIAISIPLSGINSPVLRVFNQIVPVTDAAHSAPAIPHGRTERKWSGEDRRRSGKGHLILSVINSGNSDEFMNAAREAGATGGTIINARGLAHEGTVKFFGISVQSEREIILIISTEEKKAAIMESISRSFGINTKAEGSFVSLPVDTIIGLS